MSWGLVVAGGAAVLGAFSSDQSSKRSTEASASASQAAIVGQESAQQSFNRRTQPFSDLGLAAGTELAQLLGLNVPNPEISRLQSDLSAIDERIAAGPPPPPKKRKKRSGTFGSLLGGFIGEDLSEHSLAANIGERIDRESDPDIPGTFNLEDLQAERAGISSQLDALQSQQQPLEGEFLPAGSQSQLEQINPILSFLRDEGFQDIQETAAGQGSLGSGGTLKDLTRFNTQLGATIVPQLQQQRFNQLFNVLGLGSNAATGQGTTGLQTATNIGNLQGNIGQFQAQNASNQGNSQRELLGNAAGIFGAFQGGAFGQNAPQQVTNAPNNASIVNPNRFEAFS